MSDPILFYCVFLSQIILISALRCFTWVIIKTRTSLLAECEVVPNRLLRYPHMRSLLNTRRVLNDPEIQFAV